MSCVLAVPYVLNAVRLGTALCLECRSSSMPYVFNAVRLGGPGVPEAPNARHQARPMAGATQERRLLGVACMP